MVLVPLALVATLIQLSIAHLEIVSSFLWRKLQKLSPVASPSLNRYNRPMPLREGSSDKVIAENIATLIEEGYDRDQAVAIAYDKAERGNDAQSKGKAKDQS